MARASAYSNQGARTGAQSPWQRRCEMGLLICNLWQTMPTIAYTGFLALARGQSFTACIHHRLATCGCRRTAGRPTLMRPNSASGNASRTSTTLSSNGRSILRFSVTAALRVLCWAGLAKLSRLLLLLVRTVLISSPSPAEV